METIWIIFLFATGACVGSFLNVVIWRLPRGQSIVFPGSHCPKCGRGIHWYDNIPLVSWCALRGKCRFCKEPISPRYLLIELTTAILVAGLFICYFVLNIRQNPQGGLADPGLAFPQTPQAWAMYIAHAALLCGLLVCAAVDIEMWLVPLEVTWVVALVGVAAATYSPHPWMPSVSPTTAAMSFAAAIGLVIAIILMRLGYIQPSFVDASEKSLEEVVKEKPGKGKGAKGDSDKSKPAKAKAPAAVAITSADGVNPRKEILRELVFLAPAIVLALVAHEALTRVPAMRQAWSGLLNPATHPQLSPHILGAAAAVFGYLIGGALIWGTRILGTLAFGKEAMGLGDVHILAAIGAVAGWIVPTIAFFVAPVLGLLWALYLFFGRKQRELPYGPWLAAGTLLAMLGYDLFGGIIRQYAEMAQLLR
jgi:leader peptidase (prepilin peptidase)/N-methyltransferase